MIEKYLTTADLLSLLCILVFFGILFLWTYLYDLQAKSKLENIVELIARRLNDE